MFSLDTEKEASKTAGDMESQELKTLIQISIRPFMLIKRGSVIKETQKKEFLTKLGLNVSIFLSLFLIYFT